MVVIAVLGLMYGMDTYVIAPWAHGDGPKLTGTWVGAFVTPTGRHGVLELALRHEPAMRRGDMGSKGRGRLTGTARSCGLVDWPAYDLAGSANRSATDVSIVITVPHPAPSGYYVHELRGRWAGDSLLLAGVLSSYAGLTHTYHGGAADENQATHITLRPGADTDFDKACAAKQRRT